MTRAHWPLKCRVAFWEGYWTERLILLLLTWVCAIKRFQQRHSRRAVREALRGTEGK